MERFFIKSYEPLVNALTNAEKKVGSFFKVVKAIGNFDYCLKLSNKLEPEHIAMHAIFSDVIDEILKQWIEEIKEMAQNLQLLRMLLVK